MAERIIRIVIESSGAVTGANRVANALGKVTRASKTTRDGTRQMTDALDRTSTSASRTASSVARLHSAFISLAGGLAAALAIRQVIATVRDFVTVQKEFGAAMSTVAAITKATTEEFDDMEMTARQLGATTVFSASQAAEGMLFLGRAGYDTNKIIETIPATLDLATAAALDLGRAADITTNIMSAFNIQASETTEIADTLAVIANSANTDVSQMGDAMKFVGPVAHSLGITMRDTAAAIGVLSNAGLQGAMAGTGLRRAFSELISPSKRTKEIIRELGLTLEEVDPAANKVSTVFQRFKMAGLEAGQALEIFGDRGGPAALVLTEMSGQLETMEGLVQNVTGESERMAEVMRDNLAGDLKILTSVFQEAILQTGDKGLTGAFRGLIKTSTGLLQVWTDTIDPLDENIDRYKLMANAIETTVVALTAFVGFRVAAYLFEMAAGALKTISAFFAQRNAIIAMNKVIAEQTVLIDANTAATARWVATGAGARFVQQPFIGPTLPQQPLPVPGLLGGLGATAGLIGGTLAIGGIIAYRKEIAQLLDPLERLRKQIDDQKTSMLKVSRETDHLVERYKELVNIENRTNTQQSELNISTNRLIQLHPELADVIDRTTGSFHGLEVALRQISIGDKIKELTGSLEIAEKALAVLEETPFRTFTTDQLRKALEERANKIGESKAEIAEFRTEIEKLTNDLEALRATGKTVEELAGIFHNVFQAPSMLSLTTGIDVLSFGRDRPDLGDPEEFQKQMEAIIDIKKNLERELLTIGLEGAAAQIQTEKNRTEKLLDENTKAYEDIRDNVEFNEEQKNALISKLGEVEVDIRQRQYKSIEDIVRKAGDKLKETTMDYEEELTTIGLKEGDLRRQQIENEYNERLRILRRSGNQAIEAARDNSTQLKQIIQDLADQSVAIEQAKQAKLDALLQEEADKRRKIHEDTTKEIEGVLNQLDPSYQRDIKSIEAWRTDTESNLDKTADNYQEMMDAVEKAYFLQIEEARRRDLENSKDWQAGLIRANQAIVDATEDQARRIEDIWLDVYNGLNDNTARFLLGMEQSWDSYFQNIQLKIAQNALDQLIFAPIAQSLANSGSNARFEQGNKSGGFGGFFGSLLGGLFGGGGLPIFDSGGISTKPGLYYAGVPEAHIPLSQIKEVNNSSEKTVYIDNRTTIQAKDYNSFKPVEDQVMNRIALKQKRSQQRNRV